MTDHPNAGQKDAPPPAQPVRYFTPAQIGWATAIASPYAGILMTAQNLRTFEKPDMAKKTLVYGHILMTCYVVLALSVKLPSALGLMFFALTGLLFAHFIRKYQGRDIKYLVVQGFAAHSLWRVVKISALGLGLLLAASYIVTFILMIIGVDVIAIHTSAQPASSFSDTLPTLP